MIKFPLNTITKVRTYTNDLYLNAAASANCGVNNLLASLNFVENNVEICSDKSNKPVRIFINKMVSFKEKMQSKRRLTRLFDAEDDRLRA